MTCLVVSVCRSRRMSRHYVEPDILLPRSVETIQPPTRWINLGIVKLVTPRPSSAEVTNAWIYTSTSWQDDKEIFTVAFGVIRTNLTVASLDKPLLMNVRRILNVTYNLCS
jgi:hypothetical protein